MADYSGDYLPSTRLYDALANLDQLGDVVGHSDAFKMVGRRSGDSVWVSWIVYGSPDATGAQYTGGALVADTIHVAP